MKYYIIKCDMLMIEYDPSEKYGFRVQQKKFDKLKCT